MQKIYTLILFLSLFGTLRGFAQNNDRLEAIEQKLNTLSATVPGLKQKVQLTVNNVSLQDYLSALARSNNLSINMDPKLNVKVNNSLNDVSAVNVLVFLAKVYNLDIQTIGSIIMVEPYVDPNLNARPPLKEISVKYDQLGNTLSVELNNDSLSVAARKITQLSGKNIVVPGALLGKKVTAYIKSAPFDAALEKIAFSNELKMVKTGDNFYLFQALGEGEELYINGDKNTSSRRTFKPASGPAGGINLFSKVVGGQKLISADAVNAPIAELVKAASQEMGKNYFLYTEIKGNISTHIADISYNNFLGSLFQGTDYTFREENGVYLVGDRKLEGLRTRAVVQLQNRSIDTVLAMIPTEWKKGVEIHEFREQNTLILSGSGPQIQEIQSLIKQLDLLVPMVMIEITMVDINKSRTVATGIQLGVGDSTAKTGGTILPGVNFTVGAASINNLLDKVGGSSLNLGHVVPNFYATLKALETSGNVEVHSIPKLTTLNGHTASLSIGNTRYYLIQTQNVIPSLTSPTSIYSQQYNKIDANMVINIKPVVSGDDQVTLGIKVDITDFVGTPPANAPAPTSTSKFESIVRAHNEDMIVLGGLERTTQSDDVSGTPILSRIPILKYIFSTRSHTTSKVVTLVFIKPTILR